MIKSKFQSKYFILLIVFISYLFIGNMLAVFSTVLPYRDIVKILISFVGCSVMILYLFNHKVKRTNILLISLMFVIFSILPTFFLYYETSSFSYAMLEIGESFTWIGVLTLSYYFGVKNIIQIDKVKWLAYFIPIYSLLFLGVKQFSSGTGIPLISTAYYALFLLPFVFLLENELIKWALVLLVFSTVLLSVKRTGFIAFVLCLVVYFYYNIKYYNNGNISRKKKIQLMTITLLVAIILYIFFNYYVSSHSIGIIDRLGSISEDGGSGRTDVWIYTWNMIKNSNFFSLIFGHGFNAVYQFSELHLSAHNDFLEVIYDYGIVGFCIYLIFIKRLFYYFKIIKKEKRHLIPSYAVSLVLFICMSLFAHLVIYPTHFLFLCLFWGIVVGNIDYNVMKKRRKNN